MTKKIFLDKLKRKLSILNEEEKQDILSEYKDIIEEKMKHGQTEEEAVADFGDFEELISEILSAYKINPKVGKEESTTKEKAKDFLETGEELIKDGAKRLTKVTDKIVNDFKESNTEITVELVFELILKGLCALIIMGILTVPFILLSEIGTNVFNFVVFPLSPILRVLWKILVSLLYFGTCFFLLIAIFKNYVRKPNTTNMKGKQDKQGTKESHSKVTPKKEDSEIKDHEKEIIAEEKREPKKIVSQHEFNQSTHTVSKLIIILLKIFIVFTFIIPLWITIICLFILLSILIFLLIKGISIIGMILGIMGVIIFLIQLCNLLYNGLFNAYKAHIYPFIISLVLVVVGMIMTMDFVVGIDYLDVAPSAHLKSMAYEYTLTKPAKIEGSINMEYIIDNTLPDSKAIIEVSYYDEYTELRKNEVNTKESLIICFHQEYMDVSKKTYNLVIDNLKNNKVYNYEKLRNNKIKITGNENTKNLIIID